jgi:3-isopropylmalate/(R)-2-methylmalate dehydratase large subunit
MKEMGVKRVWDKDRVVFMNDHISPATNIQNATLHKQCRDIARLEGFSYFYDINAGVCHQVLPEKGHVWPGALIVGADSHTCTHGAFGAFATGIGSTDMGAALATGRLWFKVPETIRVVVNGKLSKYVAPKDVILNAAKRIGADGATYMALEFGGDTIQTMSVAGRMTLCNMAVELGGKTGIVEPDEIVLKWLRGRVKERFEVVLSDEDAEYFSTVEIDAESLVPQVACPHSVDNVKPVTDVVGTTINQVFIGSCTNGRVEDLAEAADIIRGRRIHRDIRLIVTPSSYEVYNEANRKGIIRALISSGAVICNPSCGACFGGNNGVIAPGEVSLSTSNRNFRGRQGSTEGYVYLSSPATAAASALKGVISDPRETQS